MKPKQRKEVHITAAAKISDFPLVLEADTDYIITGANPFVMDNAKNPVNIDISTSNCKIEAR